ncbi:Odorant receptor [Operophtera brumata]|uniref:Odorant receptor n=1 Tax=Operophtera brumata TaxID=104452 RepID=A0A0L7LA30_OPEBR|nr:Odorant receptor [Operophtera brumata]
MAKISENICNYLHYVELPLKLVACWEWIPKAKTLMQVMVNNIYLGLVLFALLRFAMGLSVHLYTEWVDIMSCLDEMADSLPLIVSLAIVSYYAIYRDDLYELITFMNANFKHHSAQGLTNMTMARSYETAKRFSKIYTACTMFSVTMVDQRAHPRMVVRGRDAQTALCVHVPAVLSVFFAANSILICGQLELLCCSLRNLRYTALLQHGVLHSAVAAAHSDIQMDEMHAYIYNQAEMTERRWHCAVASQAVMEYKDRFQRFVSLLLVLRVVQVTLYLCTLLYAATLVSTLRWHCAVVSQAVMEYKDRFDRFVSPLLVLRVVQVTLYLCTLLYAATLNFDMMTVEYLAAVALDIFVYCYYGNQIIAQVNVPIRFSQSGFLQDQYLLVSYQPMPILPLYPIKQISQAD